MVIREVDDRTVVAMALIENIQREDLNPLEEAIALQRLIDEFDLTHAQAAEAVGRSRAAVSNLLRLLELPTEIRVLVETQRAGDGPRPRAADAGAAGGDRAGAAGRRPRLVGARGRAPRAAACGRQGPGRSAAKAKPAKAKPQADIAALERELSESLNTQVNVLHGRGGKGRLVIHYTDLDSLEGVLEKLRGKADE